MYLVVIYFVYGLAFFSLGLSASLQARGSSRLPLGRQLPWLAAFGLAHSLVEWADMFRLIFPQDSRTYELLLIAHAVLLPLSAILLVRFGIGLIQEAGPLPDWLSFAPAVLLVPAALLVSYGVIVALTEPPLVISTAVWSRYLLYLPGNLLAAYGFQRQWRLLPNERLGGARRALLGAALAFVINGAIAGLIAPDAPYGLASWLNYTAVQTFTGLPVQFWRTITAFAITLLVARAMGVFETERKQQLLKIEQERADAQQAALQAQSEARQAAENWTNALFGISQHIADMDEVDGVLVSIVEATRCLLNCDRAELALWDKAGESLQLKCYAGDSGAGPASGPVKNRAVLEAVRSGSPRRFPSGADPAPQRWLCPSTGLQVQTAGIVPLLLDSRPVGAIWACRYAGDLFSPADLIGLGRLAEQAVIALEHAVMTARVQSLAVVQERGRIAREMHDGLVQVLGYLSLEMQTLEALVSQGDPAAMLAEIKQTRLSIRQAQADVRENILSLRTTLAADAGVIPALQEYVEEFGFQTGVEARLVCEVESELQLSPLAETQMVRIIQEALANVRKHAEARRVQVRLAEQGSLLYVSITDDGIGFELPPDRGHFGLSTMQERAESAGGKLTITSHPGQGTHIELWLPLLGH